MTTVAGSANLVAGDLYQFYHPLGITLDSSRNLIIADDYGVRVLSQAAIAAGNGSPPMPHLVRGQIPCPADVAVDAYGNIYVVDACLHSVYLIPFTDQSVVEY